MRTAGRLDRLADPGRTRRRQDARRRGDGAAWSRNYPIVNLIGPTGDDVRDVMVLGESGVLNCCRKDERPDISPPPRGSNGRTAR